MRGALPLLLLALTAQGDPERGKQIVASRPAGLCVLCHPAPVGEPHLQGDLAPDLRGVGARLTPDEIRARLTNPARDSIMPAYGSRPGLTRVGRAWQDRPILSDQAIEDVVAYLAGLKQ